MTIYEQNQAKIKELVPETQDSAVAFEHKARQLGKPVEVREVYRDQARQNRLWAIGRDAKGRIIGDIVTKTLRSVHTLRRAMDLYPDTRKKLTDEQVREYLAEVAEIGKEYGWLRPSGTLSWGDFGHFECWKPIVPIVKTSYVDRLGRLTPAAQRKLLERTIERYDEPRRSRAKRRLEAKNG